MRQPKAAVAAVVVVALAAGCASMPPQKPVADIKAVAGKWEGTVFTRQGTLPATAVINPDGSGVTTVPVGPGKFEVVYAVKDGIVTYQSKTTGRTGTCRLREGDGKRVLECRADDGTATAEYSPAR